jgi:hypothetical protein
MTELSVLIPILDSGDKPHHPRMWVELEKYLNAAYGGWTRSGDVHGCWHGKLEVSREYRVAGNVTDGLVRVLVDYVKDLFDQEAVYVATRDAQIV